MVRWHRLRGRLRRSGGESWLPLAETSSPGLAGPIGLVEKPDRYSVPRCCMLTLCRLQRPQTQRAASLGTAQQLGSTSAPAAHGWVFGAMTGSTGFLTVTACCIIIPSVVGFTRYARLIGHEAEVLAATQPADVVYHIKRMLGREYKDTCLQTHLPHYPFTVSA